MSDYMSYLRSMIVTWRRNPAVSLRPNPRVLSQEEATDPWKPRVDWVCTDPPRTSYEANILDWCPSILQSRLCTPRGLGLLLRVGTERGFSMSNNRDVHFNDDIYPSLKEEFIRE
jgi:hypothetical protein